MKSNYKVSGLVHFPFWDWEMFTPIKILIVIAIMITATALLLPALCDTRPVNDINDLNNWESSQDNNKIFKNK